MNFSRASGVLSSFVDFFFFPDMNKMCTQQIKDQANVMNSRGFEVSEAGQIFDPEGRRLTRYFKGKWIWRVDIEF